MNRDQPSRRVDTERHPLSHPGVEVSALDRFGLRHQSANPKAHAIHLIEDLCLNLFKT
jgi:hypothetical protein